MIKSKKIVFALSLQFLFLNKLMRKFYYGATFKHWKFVTHFMVTGKIVKGLAPQKQATLEGDTVLRNWGPTTIWYNLASIPCFSSKSLHPTKQWTENMSICTCLCKVIANMLKGVAKKSYLRINKEKNHIIFFLLEVTFG